MPRLIMVVDCPSDFIAERNDAEGVARCVVLPANWQARLVSARWSVTEPPDVDRFDLARAAADVESY